MNIWMARGINMQVSEAKVGMKVVFHWGFNIVPSFQWIEGKIGFITSIPPHEINAMVKFVPSPVINGETIDETTCGLCYLSPIELSPEEEAQFQKEQERVLDQQRRLEHAMKYL